MKKILYVHPDETIAYLIDRLENTREEEIAIVVDANPGLFMDSMNLKLLKRETDGFGKRCIIISQNPAVIEVSRAGGFDTSSDDTDQEQSYGASESAQSFSQDGTESQEEEIPVQVIQRVAHDDEPASPSYHNVSQDHHEEEYVSVESAEKEGIRIADERDEEAVPTRALNWKFLVGALGAVAILVWGGFYLFSPKLSVAITPKKETINFDFQVIADSTLSAVNAVNAHIPGQVIKIEREISDSFPATGKQDKETKAEGEIVIYNAYGASTQALVKNTRFKAKDGKLFRLASSVTVPAAKTEGGKVAAPGTVNARVVADQSGAAYNIDPTDFSVPGFQGTPKFLGFYAKSKKSFSGGGSSNAIFATRDDLDKARAVLQDKISQGAQEYITSQIPKGLKIISQGITQSDPQLSAAPVDIKNSTFKVTLKATYVIFAFSENDVVALVDFKVSGKLSEKRKAIPQTRVISYAGDAVGQDKTSFTFSAKVSELVLGMIDQDDLRRLLAGKDESEIRQLLGLNESIDSAEITFWPLWTSKAPANLDAITISVNES